MGEFFQGFSFLNKQVGKIRSHLWIILSDPAEDPEQILIANLTSYRQGRDESCIIHAGEHPFVRHTSCINYRECRITSIDSPEKGFTSGLLISEDPVEVDLLKRIQAGAFESKFTKNYHKELLENQGLGSAD